MKICWDNLENIKYNPKTKKWHKGKNFYIEIDKCITYCKKCHKEVHKKENCGYKDMQCKEVI